MRGALRRLVPRSAGYDRLPAHALARVLERHQSELGVPVKAVELSDAVAAGQGAFVATRHAIAFTVDHGPGLGVELRHLYVAPQSRRCGAGRALVARLRARHAGRNLFTHFEGDGHARFARLAGFAPAAEGGGWWSTEALPLPRTRGRLPASVLPLGCPPAPEVLAEDDRERAARALCASALAAAAALSCMDA
ncbi:MAG: hypothetical protein JSR41_04445 [Proteobacteria bacterium]|nr:hypothetical protein [Pseudomonadota bacterium]